MEIDPKALQAFADKHCRGRASLEMVWDMARLLGMRLRVELVGGTDGQEGKQGR